MGTKLETAETDKAFPTAAQGLLLLGDVILPGGTANSASPGDLPQRLSGELASRLPVGDADFFNSI